MKRIRTIIATFIVINIYYEVNATAQVADVLIYNGDSLKLFTNPLKSYFDLKNGYILPKFIGCPATSCWRGYKAIWKIEKEKLYLIKITSCSDDCGLKIKDANLKKMFRKKFNNGMVLADWFSGDLIVPYGKLIRYVHYGYASTFEKEYHFKVNNGNVVQIENFTNYIDDPKKRNRLNYYEPLFKIYNTIRRNLNWQDLPDAGSYWWEDFTVIIGTDGNIKEVINDDPEADPIYADAIFSALKNVGAWDIIQSNGQPIEEKFFLKLDFDFLLQKIYDRNIVYAMKEQRHIKRRLNKMKSAESGD